MNPVEFSSVSFAYEEERPVFTDLSLAVRPGVTSLTGPNGAGKSTFLLLASGRVLPDAGTVLLEGADTSSLEETEKSRLCSLVYQNMEFENPDPLGDLLEFVLAQGFAPAKDRAFLQTVVKAFGLQGSLAKATDALSKGAMQRAVMAFSLLYGSRVVVMDEPVFALEEDQKRSSLAFVAEYARASGVSFLYSAHELDLTRAYADHVLLFAPGEAPVAGTPAEVLTRERLEAAYKTPYALLHQKEQLHRETLLRAPTPREAWEAARNQG